MRSQRIEKLAWQTKANQTCARGWRRAKSLHISVSMTLPKDATWFGWAKTLAASSGCRVANSRSWPHVQSQLSYMQAHDWRLARVKSVMYECASAAMLQFCTKHHFAKHQRLQKQSSGTGRHLRTPENVFVQHLANSLDWQKTTFHFAGWVPLLVLNDP